MKTMHSVLFWWKRRRQSSSSTYSASTSVSGGRLCAGCGRVPGFRPAKIPGLCCGNTVKFGSVIVHILSFWTLFVSSKSKVAEVGLLCINLAGADRFVGTAVLHPSPRSRVRIFVGVKFWSLRLKSVGFFYGSIVCFRGSFRFLSDVIINEKNFIVVCVLFWFIVIIIS